MKKVAIGGGQGFWGDSPDAAIHMIRNADIQYMGCDYLAELTLSIMAKQQLKDPTKGFAPDFTTRILKEAGKEAWDKHIRICTNAGGMNINGCVDGIRQWAEGNSMSGYKIGYVTGDNIKDDTFEITKAPDCGGIICEQSCKEQFLYEVHDPANYLTPDVNVDISHATITQVGDNRVRIGGVKGKPRPDTLKLCVGYHKGWKTVSMLSFAWPDAYEKAQYCAEVIMKKMQRRGMKADDIHISYIGLNSLHLGVADMSEEALKNLNECVLRIAVFSEDKSECAKIIPEISPLQLNGPPGASFFGGRARVQEVMALWPTTVPRDAVQVESHILEVK